MIWAWYDVYLVLASLNFQSQKLETPNLDIYQQKSLKMTLLCVQNAVFYFIIAIAGMRIHDPKSEMDKYANE